MTLQYQDITVAISTHGDRVLKAIELAKSFDKLAMKVVVIHQAHNCISNSEIDSNIAYVHLNSVGVTKSRNKAIELCKTRYLWFMDDDVELDSQGISRLITTDCDGFVGITFRIKDEYGALRKNYPEQGKIMNRRDALSIGTIELLVDVEFIRQQQIFFPVDMGAGSKLPIGDEAVFVAKIIRNKGLLKHISATPLVHPAESSGTQESKINVVSKGFMLRKVFGWQGVAPLIYLVFRLRGGSRLDIATWLLRGFFK